MPPSSSKNFCRERGVSIFSSARVQSFSVFLSPLRPTSGWFYFKTCLLMMSAWPGGQKLIIGSITTWSPSSLKVGRVCPWGTIPSPPFFSSSFTSPLHYSPELGGPTACNPPGPPCAGPPMGPGLPLSGPGWLGWGPPTPPTPGDGPACRDDGRDGRSSSLS